MLLRLRTRRLKRAGKNRKLRVPYGAGHLRMREVFVDEDPLDERSIRQRAANLAVDLNQVEWYIFPLEVSHG